MLQYRRIRFGTMSWRARIGVFVGVALALALAIAVVILSLGLALILLPVVAIALLIARWRLNRLMAAARADGGQPAQTRTIEIDYHVLDDRDRR